MEDILTVRQPTEDIPGDVPPTEPQAPPTEDGEGTRQEPTSTMDYAALELADIEQLKGDFPELASLRSLTELEQPSRYGALRDLGLSPKEAYLATELRRAKAIDNRAHLRSAIPHAAVGAGESISASELAAARELFLGLSDHEIRKLYKKVTV